MSDFDFEKIRRNKIDQVDDNRKQARKNRALLSYKYDALKYRINILQVLIIIISSMITFLEAIKQHYEFNETDFNAATISMSTMVAFIMAIYRFFRYEENKENVKQSLESHVFIINKLCKTRHLMQNFEYTDNNYADWIQICLNYDTETFDNYIAIKEKFDALFSFQDSIYYKRKYKRDFLELEFTNREIELVDKFKDSKHNDFVLRLKGWLYYLFCCMRRERVDYSTFMKKAEEGTLEMMSSDVGTQTGESGKKQGPEMKDMATSPTHPNPSTLSTGLKVPNAPQGASKPTSISESTEPQGADQQNAGTQNAGTQGADQQNAEPQNEKIPRSRWSEKSPIDVLITNSSV